MSKIYTRKGDTGTSTLSSKERISKDDVRFTLLGDLDELNSQLGVVKTLCQDTEEQAFIESVQERLIQLSGFIYDARKDDCRVLESDIAALEGRIDGFDARCKFEGFTIPGVNLASAQADVCRAVCRRCERSFVAVSRNYDTDPNARSYVNRLSDYLYTLSRALERQNGLEKG